MSKVHLLSQIVENLQKETSQAGKYDLLSQYEKEAILKRVVSIAYNPWINLEMQNFEPKRMGKKFVDSNTMERSIKHIRRTTTRIYWHSK